MADTYKIVRYFEKRTSQTIKTGLTLEEAQAHCSDPNTSSQMRTTNGRPARRSHEAITRTLKYGPWFDGYTKESS